MISLYDIIQVSNGQLYGEPAGQIFTEFCIDSTRVTPNSLYVALKTDWGDSHRYAEEAIRAGATGVLCVRPPDCDTRGVSIIMVQDTVQALMQWAQYILAKTGVKVIGVTGSSGKSVAVQAISQVLSAHYRVHHSPVDTTDNRLSIPLALARLETDHQFVVMRLGATQPGEMAAMIEACQPQVGVVLTVDYNHTDRFENIEQVASEYRQLVDYLSPGSLAVLNYDDDRVRAMTSRLHAKSMTISVDNFGANIMAYNVVAGPNGTGFDLRYGNERYIGKWIPLLGKHQLYSVLAALAVGMHYEISIEAGLKALGDIQPLPGRMNPLIGLNDCLLIDDTHSATPQSTMAALDWIANARDTGQRVILVLGDMDHLGSHSQIGHRQVGQQAAELVDIFITEGTEAAAAGRAALDMGMDSQYIYTTFSTYDTVQALREHFKPSASDLILVKGGISAHMERVVQALLKETNDHTRLVRQQAVDGIPDAFQPMRPSWIEVDTEALAGNVRALKTMIGDQVELMAVVKADGYGHGAAIVGQTALLNGATYLAVANLQEALDLRQAGVQAPILILSYTPVYAVREAIRQNLTVTLYDLDLARAYDRTAREMGGTLKVHVKIDTGMGRLGVLPVNAMTLFRHLLTMHHIEIEGVYTHFSVADEDPEYTAEQVTAFKNILRPLKATGINFKYIHSANSAGTIASADNHFNMVRCGIALYGLHPSETVRLPDTFRPVMTWKTVVAQIKTLPPNHMIGYGNTYRTTKEETIAIIPIGYADGFRRAPHWGEVLVRGKRAPIVGRVSMEKTMLNISDISDVVIGDEVVLLGKQGNETITAEEVAKRLGTINYEVVCGVLPRVPRR